MNNLNILYIEDDPEILENVSFLLSRYTNEVFTATNGEEALKVYKEKQPDIVVSDINIPKINGLKVAEIIREENPSVPIIIISAHNEDHQLKIAKELNVSSYIRKPFTLQELKDAIAKAIKEK